MFESGQFAVTDSRRRIDRFFGDCARRSRLIFYRNPLSNDEAMSGWTYHQEELIHGPRSHNPFHIDVRNAAS